MSYNSPSPPPPGTSDSPIRWRNRDKTPPPPGAAPVRRSDSPGDRFESPPRGAPLRPPGTDYSDPHFPPPPGVPNVPMAALPPAGFLSVPPPTSFLRSMPDPPAAAASVPDAMGIFQKRLESRSPMRKRSRSRSRDRRRSPSPKRRSPSPRRRRSSSPRRRSPSPRRRSPSPRRRRNPSPRKRFSPGPRGRRKKYSRSRSRSRSRDRGRRRSRSRSRSRDRRSRSRSRSRRSRSRSRGSWSRRSRSRSPKRNPMANLPFPARSQNRSPPLNLPMSFTSPPPALPNPVMMQQSNPALNPQVSAPPPQQEPMPPNVGYVQKCKIREFINHSSCIAEMAPDAQGNRASVYFHACCSFVPNPQGNPYGQPVRYQDLPGGHNTRPLRDFFPLGSDVKIQINALQNQKINMVGTAVWPTTTEFPAMEFLTKPPQDLDGNLQAFLRSVGFESSVTACVNGFDSPIIQPARAYVAQVMSDEYGMAEVKMCGEANKFLALFTREEVYLKDGKRAVEHDFFKDKSLRDMVSTGQPCTLAARSILNNKGFALRAAGTIELQAVVLSLNPLEIPESAPRPTSIPGGPGCFGVSSLFTHTYLNEDLKDNLNRKLAQFLKLSGRQIPNLDNQCVIFKLSGNDLPVLDQSGPARPSGQPQIVGNTILLPKIFNITVKVSELLTEYSGLLESLDQSSKWRCLFTSQHVLVPQGQSMKDVARPGAHLQLNATLIDAQRSSCQYLATLVWDARQFSEQQVSGRNRDIDKNILQKYYDVTDILAFESPASDMAPAKPTLPGPSSTPPGPAPEMPGAYVAQEGSVFRLLDENFGLVRVNNNLVLFDVCDFWVSPGNTASKEGKTLASIVNIDSRVCFNAALLDEKVKIQYLASSIWLKSAPGFTAENRPQPIMKEMIHKQKVEIFHMVVKSVSDTLPDLKEAAKPQPAMPAAPAQAQPMKIDPKDVYIKRPGTIRCLFVHGNELLGGLIEMEGRRCSFFLSDNSACREKLSYGMKVNVNVARVRDQRWSSRIGFIVLSIYTSGEVLETAASTRFKVETSVQKLNEIVIVLAAPGSREEPVFLRNPCHPVWPVINLEHPELHQVEPPKIEETESFAHFKCMISEECGLLEDTKHQGKLIYFELTDLNLDPKVTMDDLAPVLSNMVGVEVKYFAAKVDNPWVRLAAHEKGVQVTGELPSHMSHVRQLRVHKHEMKPMVMDKEKSERFRQAMGRFERKEYQTLEDMKRRQKASQTVLSQQKGIIKFILNENFGLIYGPNEAREKSYCLFDTCDLHVSNKATAAETGTPVKDVVSLGETIMYNACLIDVDACVPYLATGAWSPAKVTEPLLPLSLKTIQKEKIDIYRQVVKSCEGMLKKDESKKVKKSEPLVFALKDRTTTGSIRSEKGETFSIVELNTGEKALLSTNRVWIHDKPKFGGWRALYMDFFKVLNICARKVHGFSDFKYQIVFAHTGMRKRLPRTNEFDYPSTMKAWIADLEKVELLDNELEAYKKR